MKKALRLAEKGKGRTSPNPMVGALIVRDGEVVATGFHKKAGDNHAEIEALSALKGGVLQSDTLYVTLEPCTHYGKTPPCAEAILRSGIKRVVVGMEDPNPNVSGGGIRFLREHGVRVDCGILESECRKLNEAFVKFVKTGRPFIIAKSALTMDGWTATAAGNSKWITNEKSRRFVHYLRDSVDAVMVGAGTIIADNPSLTTRLGNRKCKDPIRIILDTNFRIPHNAAVLNNDSDSMTYIVVGADTGSRATRDVKKENVSFIRCPAKENVIDLDSLMDILGKMSITSLMVEGGSKVMGSMIRGKLIDKFYIFKAPVILGGDDAVPMAVGATPAMIDDSIRMRDLSVKRFDEDILIIGYI
ncbi:MAG: bifunctional diaminohydroxyphosphoribosylaminopyrimidine deaminase/5-amino-6-(5-phosphoribosylamino)uracil reductase RibD [Deltaproteobacteria bacterium]|nr:bifunctional diaminohydroxyphosphoribosylaminopyrimidine deaminase/5-amino-6-(5-phosphoribosylamino)uracil reductase RibD [Deltaproteobacteria bacterium]